MRVPDPKWPAWLDKPPDSPEAEFRSRVKETGELEAKIFDRATEMLEAPGG